MTGTPAEQAARDELSSRTRIMLRPLASPLPVGFFGLGAATFVVSGLQLGWVAPSESTQVALCVLAFTAPLQLLASLIGFLAHDGAAATGMGLLAGIWAVVGFTLLSAEPGATSRALGMFLLLAGVAMLAPASSAASGKLVPALVLATAATRFLVTGIYELTGAAHWEDAAGVVGLVLAALALYAAFGAEYEDVLKRSVLPLGRRREGRVALEGTYTEQVADLPRAPGVRTQL